jgi:hypothetical protein
MQQVGAIVPANKEDAMIKFSKIFGVVMLVSLMGSGGPAFAQAIENELVLITPVARTLTDPALADFAKYA